MAADNKIGLSAVGGVARIHAPRKLPGEAAAPMRAAAPTRAATEAVPAPRLIVMAGELASQGPPVDVSRVATVRTAIADGRYAADPGTIAQAMTRFFEGAQ